VNWKVGGGYPESECVRNVVDALNDAIGINVAVRSPDNSISSLVLGLDTVLVGIAILVLANLVLGVELVGSCSHWLSNWSRWLSIDNGLSHQVGLSNNGLVDGVLLGLDGDVLLGLADDVLLGLDGDVGLGLADDVLGLSDNLLDNWCCRNVGLRLGLNDELLRDDRLNGGNGDIWLGDVLNGFNWGSFGDNLFLGRLVGDGLSDQLEVFFSGSDDFGGILNRKGETSRYPESGLVGDVIDRLDLTVSVDVVVVAGDDSVLALLFAGCARLGVAELIRSLFILAVVLSQDGNGDDFLGSFNRGSCNRGGFLDNCFLRLLNSWDSCIDHLSVDLLDRGWDSCIDHMSVDLLDRGWNTVDRGVMVLSGIVRIGGRVWQVSVLHVWNDDALLGLNSCYNRCLFGLNFDGSGFGFSCDDDGLGFGFDGYGFGGRCLGGNGDGLSDGGNWQVGGGHPESQGVRNIVGGLDDAVGIDVGVGSGDDPVGSPQFALGRVLVAVAVVVLADLILSVELVCGQGDGVGVTVDWGVGVVSVRCWLGRCQTD